MPPRTRQTRGKQLLRRSFGGAGAGGSVDWLIVGLGNPGAPYAGTRHNVGFMVAEELVSRWDLGKAKDRFRGRLIESTVRLGSPAGSGEEPVKVRIALLCPQTFMNDAGRSVGPARGFYKLALERVLVVHDEIDLPFKDIRTRVGGGLAGHNGLKSVRKEIGSPDFARVRVGVGRPDTTDPEIVSAHVLGRFTEPPEQVRELVVEAGEHVERAISGQEPLS